MSHSDSDSSMSITVDDINRQTALLTDYESDIDVNESDSSDSENEQDSDSRDSDSDSHSDIGDRPGVSNVRGCGAHASQWSHNEFPTEARVFDLYRGPPRPQVNLISAFDYFSLVFSKDVYKMMATQTNLYARQNIMASGVPADRVDESFEPTTVDEIRAYIGLLMFMNISPIPNLILYWSDNSICYNPWVSSVMSRNRFHVSSALGTTSTLFPSRHT